MEEKDALFKRNLALLKARYRAGGVPKINGMEREILEFCHGRDMVEFVREEFRKNPILYDEYGNPINNPEYTTDTPTDTFFGGSDTKMLLSEGKENCLKDEKNDGGNL